MMILCQGLYEKIFHLFWYLILTSKNSKAEILFIHWKCAMEIQAIKKPSMIQINFVNVKIQSNQKMHALQEVAPGKNGVSQ